MSTYLSLQYDPLNVIMPYLKHWRHDRVRAKPPRTVRNTIRQYLKSKGISVTPMSLIDACKSGDVSVTKMLLLSGVNVHEIHKHPHR